MSPSIMVQNGPATTRVRSITLNPCSGAMPGDYSRESECDRLTRSFRWRTLRCDRANARDREVGDVSCSHVDVVGRRLEDESKAFGNRILPDPDNRLCHDAPHAAGDSGIGGLAVHQLRHHTPEELQPWSCRLFDQRVHRRRRMVDLALNEAVDGLVFRIEDAAQKHRQISPELFAERGASASDGG